MARRKREFRGRTNTHQTIDGPDRLSELPESLIIQILSLLEMEDAVKTCTLSKRWKNLWKQVDNIVYERLHAKDNEIMSNNLKMELRHVYDVQWTDFIDHSLMQCNVKIKTFSLASLAKFSLVMLHKWISYVIDNKVETLKLDLYCQVPDCLFQSWSITKMELFNVRIYTSPTVNLSSLKSLLLGSICIDNVVIDKILIGCPVLENLVLHDVSGISRLSIMSPSVKILKMWYFGDGGEALKIKAPWLQELKISGQFPFTKCELVDVSSLLKATLTFHTHLHAVNGNIEELETEFDYSWIAMLTELLKSLSYVGELIIGSELLQVMSLSKLSGTPSPLFMCKHLSIKTYLWKFDIPGIACLLENAPHLETLLLKVVPFSYKRKDSFPFYQTHIHFREGDPHLNMPNGKFPHLKNVKIEYGDDNIMYNNGRLFDFELVEYILKSAVVLEKLVLCSSRGWSCSDSTCLVPNCLFHSVFRLHYKLIITIMRLTGNKAAGWEFKKINNASQFTFSNYASLFSTADSSSSSKGARCLSSAV